ncbi:MAG TPA: hypothetical protein ENN80_07380 [Candidatus Hydrogenedentes bacterium]|nr:hypothetical protein [Candidatus Hydrogenedentota bacterium]
MRCGLIPALCVVLVAGSVRADDAGGKPGEEPQTVGQYDQLRLDEYGELVIRINDKTIERISGGVKLALLSDDAAMEPLPIEADRVRFTWDEEDRSIPARIILEGGVVVQHAKGAFKADRADWDFKAEKLIFTGNAEVLLDQGTRLRCDEIQLDFVSGEFTLLKGRGGTIYLTPPSDEKAPGEP